jgi:Plasmid replication region DNA-binding N-term
MPHKEMLMDEADVAQAIATLREQGKEPSIGNLRKVIGGGSLRDITRHRRALLPQMGRVRIMTTTAVADTPAPAVPAPAPVPLLVQVEQQLQSALVTERQAQRAYHLATAPADRARCQQIWFEARKAREQIETRLQQLTRSRDTRLAAIPGLRIAARRAAGELLAVQEQARRSLAKAQREADMAQEELDRLLNDVVAIAGAGAVPREQA